jgi:hypothetical protein
MLAVNWTFWAVLLGQSAVFTLGYLLGFRHAMHCWLKASRNNVSIEYQGEIYFVDCIKPRRESVVPNMNPIPRL